MPPKKTILNQYIMATRYITAIRTHPMRYCMYIIYMYVITLIHGNSPNFRMHHINTFDFNIITFLINTNNTSFIPQASQMFSTNHTTPANSDILKFHPIKTTIYKSSSCNIIYFITFEFIKFMLINSRSKIYDIRVIFRRSIYFRRVSKNIKILSCTTTIF